jgi:hypothetical protein
MIDISEVFVFSFIRLDSGSSCVEFFLHPKFELNEATLVKSRTSAPSKLR